MKALALLVLLTGCPRSVWTPQPLHEDLRACNIARAGNSAGVSDYNFDRCMQSLGYERVLVDEAKP